jgi:hypothetical protein
MSTIPTPASVPEALDTVDDAISYFETADFRAMPAEGRLEYLHALCSRSPRAPAGRASGVLRSGSGQRGKVVLDVSEP